MLQFRQKGLSLVLKEVCVTSRPLFLMCLPTLWATLITQLVKDLPAMQETLILFLGWEVHLEKG